MSRNFLQHVHANKVSQQALKPTSTFGLGIACLTCLGILLVTGITLFPYYLPDQSDAYERILHIVTTLRFGRVVRNLHFLAANALIIFSVLHLARVVFTGSYKNRWLNWSYGLILFFLVMFANFTGYLLPWDQISYWAIKVGASLTEYVPYAGPVLKNFLLGGSEIGPETLLRSFAFHAGIIPPLMISLVGLHLWRIRKDGGLAVSEVQNNSQFYPSSCLCRAEGGVAFSVLALLLMLALFIEAPIYERANPSHPPNPAKAPWFFVGVQEMTSYSAFIGGVVMPTAMILFLLFLPKLDRSMAPGGRWFAADRWTWSSIFIAILCSQIIFIIIGEFFRGPNWQLVLPF